MKKVILTMAICLASLTMYAQNWSIGGRIGSGFQFDAQYDTGKGYVEGRFGAGFLNGINADFTALYNWKLFEWNWTPNAGQWFFDAGVGLNIGGAEHRAYLGPAGMARFGIKFNGAPVSLSFDWTPSVSTCIHYGDHYYNHEVYYHESGAHFNAMAFANFGITCVVQL